MCTTELSCADSHTILYYRLGRKLCTADNNLHNNNNNINYNNIKYCIALHPTIECWWLQVKTAFIMGGDSDFKFGT